jgi:DNA-directed RNA polymerase subunit M/transcription elongation factor TFIIS
MEGAQGADTLKRLRDQPPQTLSRSNEIKKQIPVWECPRCSYVMTAQEEIGDEEELLAEFERAGQTIAEGERDPKPGEIAQCFRCGKFAVIGEDLQLRMPTTDEQLAINTNAHLTESQIVWASFTGARRK